MEAAALMFKALAEPARLRLLEILMQRSSCVSELAELSGEEISAVSQRLRVLRNVHLVTRLRQGKHMIYALADDHVKELVKNALEHGGEKL